MIDKQRLRTFLFGGAIGALAGILLAPRSGRELRGSVANRAGEARERSRERYFETQERMQERLSESREGLRRRPEPMSGNQPTVGSGVPKEPTGRTYGTPGRPPLRDVSRDVVERSAGETADEAEVSGESGVRSDELRRKVRETRERLRGRTSEDRPSADASPVSEPEGTADGKNGDDPSDA